MFDLVVDNVHYFVNFQHMFVNGWRLSYETVCRIFVRNHDGSPEYLYNGVAQCSWKDHFDKSRGRKIALAKALQNGVFDLSDRKAFWKKYLGMSKETKKFADRIELD